MTSDLLYDVQAEECALGAALLAQPARETLLRSVTTGDYGLPSHADIHEAIDRLHRQGVGVDHKTVSDELRTLGVDLAPGKLVELQANVPATAPASVARYCETILAFALRRREAALGAQLAAAAGDLTKDPVELLDTHRAQLADIDSPIVPRDPGDVDLEEFLARPMEQRAPWIAPGLIRWLWRVIVVAPEGVGKSMVLRQIAVLVAFGIHPFTFGPIEPRSALIVDLENPPDVVQDWVGRLTAQSKRRSTSRAPASLWLRPGGIDLRRRRDRADLEAVLRRRRPQLVVMGPLYKAFSHKAAENDEQAASEAQEVLDDLRTRFEFAFIAEHHAPKSNKGQENLCPSVRRCG